MGRTLRKAGIIIAKGKTKKIISTKDPEIVDIENNDILSKSDGKVLYTLPGKGIWATDTTCNVFELLRRHDVPVAYIGRINERTFSAFEADMVGLEIVVRNIAFGSYLKRYPEEQEGKVFSRPVIEFYYKSDKESDPLAVFDLISGCWLFFDAKKPVKEIIRVIPDLVTKKGILVDADIVKQIIAIARQINLILRETWKKQKVALVDFKFEVGFIKKDGIVTLVVADVIDNDSWRIWILGDQYRMLDKEVFRMLKEVSEEDRDNLKENYKMVAEATGIFLK